MHCSQAQKGSPVLRERPESFACFKGAPREFACFKGVHRELPGCPSWMTTKRLISNISISRGGECFAAASKISKGGPVCTIGGSLEVFPWFGETFTQV